MAWLEGLTPTEHREARDAEAARIREDELRREIWQRENDRDAEMRDREERRDAETKNRYRNELVVFGPRVSVATIIGGVLDGASAQA